MHHNMPTTPTHQTVRTLMVEARAVVARVFARVQKGARQSPRPTRRKGEGDFVTEVDLAAERQLRRELLHRFPLHGFLGEEGAAIGLDREFVWVCDPVDGTSNYAAGLPTFAVAAACMREGKPVAAAMAVAPEQAIYSAGHGLGAFRNGRRIRLGPSRLDDAAIVGVQWLRGPNQLRFLPALLNTGTRVRNLGCTVVQLCDVAMGRLQANLQEQGRIWDIAAPALVVMESGGCFTDWSGKPIYPLARLDPEPHYPSLAAGKAVHQMVLRSVREAKARR